MKYFNVTGLCVPGRDYMCDVSGKVSQIAAMVERGSYFTINRARQYGKTTMLALLEKRLNKEYTVIKISFEGVDDEMFETPSAFCQGLLRQCAKYFDERGLPGAQYWQDSSITTFDLLDKFLTKICNNKKLVLMIDEVDKTSNNLIFLKFLGMLRDKYLKRSDSACATFQSVILCEKRINSPWNIATNFNVDMSLSEKEIASMLADYEKDHKTEMDIEAISKEIRAYTNGYPYLVSRICQKIEEELGKDWTIKGVQNAVKIILNEPNLLFDDLGKNMESNEELSSLLYDIVINGAGFCHVESETRNAKRMDVIVDYNTEQFIVELKLWYGEQSHEKAYEQLAGYLDSKNKDTGYLLTFDFRKENNTGKPQSKWAEHKGKRIFDCMAGI